MEGPIAQEWRDFLVFVHNLGIILYMGDDVLQWDYNKKIGKVTTKLAYEALEKKEAILPAVKFNKLIWYPH